MQQFTTLVQDTLTQSYSDKWEGVEQTDVNAFMQFMASEDLIFVVLGVTLIIWFILLFVLFRLDSKVSKLEKKLEQQDS